MISIYFITGIVSGIFFWIYGVKLRYGVPSYKRWEIIGSYIVTRLAPLLMLETCSAGIRWNLLLDAVLLVGLMVYTQRRKPEAIVGTVMMLYLFHPAVILCIVTGKPQRMALVLGSVVFLGVVEYFLKKSSQNFSMLGFFGEYVAFSGGCLGMIVAVDQLGQQFNQLKNSEEIPVVLILSIAVLLGTELSVCWKVSTGRGGYVIRKEGLTIPAVHQEKEEKWTCWDTYGIIVLTLVFALLAFFRLGSHECPQTNRILTTSELGGNELVLDFGREVTISKISIFLGYEGRRTFSFSYPDGAGGWEVFDSQHEVNSVFAWNDVDINQTIRYLGIVSLDREAYLTELVILDGGGARILPENAEEYEEIFDEQTLYPEYESYYVQTMFDEVYHGRTAYEFLNQLPIYEVTHPPLGKSIIAIGIAIFGMNPFGWRVMCVLFGTLMVPFLYLFARRLSGKTKIAYAATILLCTEFMHFTLSRIATIDVIVALFILMMFYFMYCFIDNYQKKRSLKRQIASLVLCGTATACAVSTKWTGVYAAVGIAVIFFTFWLPPLWKTPWDKKKGRYVMGILGTCVFSFLLIPGVVYVFSYLPFTRVATSKGLLTDVIDNAKLMLSYHSTTFDAHPYSSEWYEWIVDRRPLLDAHTLLTEGKASIIATFGNPVVWWGGILAGLHQIYLWLCRKCDRARFLVLAYLAMLVPWLFVHRTVFIYQYFGCSLILILMIGNSISYLGRQQKKVMTGTVAVSVLLFVMFYPVISGYPVSISYVNQILEWFTSWSFAIV